MHVAIPFEGGHYFFHWLLSNEAMHWIAKSTEHLFLGLIFYLLMLNKWLLLNWCIAQRFDIILSIEILTAYGVQK